MNYIQIFKARFNYTQLRISFFLTCVSIFFPNGRSEEYINSFGFPLNFLTISKHITKIKSGSLIHYVGINIIAVIINVIIIYYIITLVKKIFLKNTSNCNKLK